MQCQRCHKKITEQTARLYQDRCVPCYRKRPSERLRDAASLTWGFLSGFVTAPFVILWQLPGFIWRRLAPLPFTRREILEAMAPLHGQEAAGMYFRGLRQGFQDKKRWECHWSGISPFYEEGHDDGQELQLDLSLWPAILEKRLLPARTLRERAAAKARKMT